ncbi:MAG: thiosulfate/3-mercaptopyruvate sulfurtransferase [Chloroflexota bacterium]|nr:thiosulfate/3-mercaptopyruvate sulfurtransferase [Chloroflexota bacterium]
MIAATPSPLVSVDRLAEWLAEPVPPVVVDLRWYLGRPGDGHAAYLTGHIPGAIFLDLDDDLADPNGFGAPGRHPLPAPEAFTARMAAAGIGDGARVVGYDDVGGWVAARLWWMLDNLGFGRRGTACEYVGVLDGGIGAWTATGHGLETDVPRAPAHPGRLTLEGPWSRVIARGELRGRLGSVTLLDARGAPRYRGEVEPVDPIAGHIPTALSAPYDTNLGADGMLLDAAALTGRYADLGITTGVGGAGPETVISCGSGTSACHHALAMRVAGLPDPILYVGSYSDWSRSGEPIATGAEPGVAPPAGPPPTPRSY